MSEPIASFVLNKIIWLFFPVVQIVRPAVKSSERRTYQECPIITMSFRPFVRNQFVKIDLTLNRLEYFDYFWHANTYWLDLINEGDIAVGRGFL